MPPSKTRYITACQQMLALGVVLAALTPAASVVSLDVVREVPGSGAGERRRTSAPTPGPPPAARVVPTEPVDPTVTEHALTRRPRSGPGPAPSGRPSRPGPAAPGPASPRSSATRRPSRGTARSASPGPPGRPSPEDALSFEVRTRTGEHLVGLERAGLRRRRGPRPRQRRGPSRPPGHRPDAGRRRRRRCRSARWPPHGEVPAGMELAVIDPGETEAVARGVPGDRHGHAGVGRDDRAGHGRAPGGDRGHPDGRGADDRDRPRAERRDVHAHPEDLLARPVGRRRADARRQLAALLRGARRLRAPHGQRQQLHPREVPGIIRGIYAYHTRSKGWSDIGYNFLVDRFGRIWEGRYGGVDRPVVGRAHPRLQRLRVRDVGDRQLRHRPAVRRHRRGVRRAVRLEALAARRGRLLDQSAGRPGHGSRRSTATATPGRRPVRGATSTPRSRGSGSSPPRPSAAGAGASWSRTSPPRRTPTSSCGGPATSRPS